MSQDGTPLGPEGAETIGRNVQALRDALGISQETLAALSGVSQQMISYVERGEKRPSAPNLARLARSLDTTADKLLQPLPSVREAAFPVGLTPEADELDALVRLLRPAERRSAIVFLRRLITLRD